MISLLMLAGGNNLFDLAILHMDLTVAPLSDMEEYWLRAEISDLPKAGFRK